MRSKYFVTVNGQPKAVVLSFKELRSLEETAEIMAIPNAIKSIKKGLNQAKKNKEPVLARSLAEHEYFSYQRSREAIQKNPQNRDSQNKQRTSSSEERFLCW